MARRRPNGYAKRKDEILVQGWFNPRNADENRVLEAIEWIQEKHDLTRKQAIIWLVMFFIDTQQEPEVSVADEITSRVEVMLSRMSDRLMQSIAAISQLVSSGALVATNAQAQSALDEFQQEFDEIGLSVATRYRSLSFDPDEDE